MSAVYRMPAPVTVDLTTLDSVWRRVCRLAGGPSLGGARRASGLFPPVLWARSESAKTRAKVMQLSGFPCQIDRLPTNVSAALSVGSDPRMRQVRDRPGPALARRFIRVWRIEGMIAGRPGGATCAAYHLHTGERVAIDVVRHPNSGRGATAPRPLPGSLGCRLWSGRDEDGAVRLLQAEAQALHSLDQPNLLRLFETRVDEHGLAYLVTELGTARPHWRFDRGGSALATCRFPVARRARSGDSSAFGAGGGASRWPGHQGLGTHRVLASRGRDLGWPNASGAVRLRGLRALSLGRTIRASTRADLRAVAGLLYELLVGEPQVPARPLCASAPFPVASSPRCGSLSSGVGGGGARRLLQRR